MHAGGTCPSDDLTRLDVALFNWPPMPWAITTSEVRPVSFGEVQPSLELVTETVGTRIVVRGPANLMRARNHSPIFIVQADAHARTCAEDETEEGGVRSARRAVE